MKPVPHSKSPAGGCIDLPLWERSTDHAMKQISPIKGARDPRAEMFGTPGFHIKLSFRFSECFAESPGMINVGAERALSYCLNVYLQEMLYFKGIRE